MGANLKATASLAALLVGLSLSPPVPAAEQTTIFTTKDFRQDRALWTNPAYYRNNTVGQLRGMAIGVVPYEDTGQVGSSRVYGTPGTGRPGAMTLATPYPFKTAMEHYQAWLRDAKGDTKHTKATIPDWSGFWDGGGGGFGGGGSPASDVVKLLTPKYQEYFVQEVKASSEGRIWGPNSFCLPNGFFPTLGAREFITSPTRVWTLTEGNGWNGIRWIYTEGGHIPTDLQFPKWAGESVGFWNGDTLIVHTNQLKAWKGGLVEYTDDLETVEKYRRVGDKIEGEITLYDPAVLVRPVTAKLNYTLQKNAKPEERPLYNTCSDTNGPSPKIFMDDKGLLNEHIPGDAGFDWTGTDPRPWGTWLTESDRRYKAYLLKGGKPPGR